MMLNISSYIPSFSGDICLSSCIPRQKVILWCALAIISHWTISYLFPALFLKNKRIEPIKEKDAQGRKTQETAKKILQIDTPLETSPQLQPFAVSPRKNTPILVSKEPQEQEEIEKESPSINEDITQQTTQEALSHEPVLLETPSDTQQKQEEIKKEDKLTTEDMAPEPVETLTEIKSDEKKEALSKESESLEQAFDTQQEGMTAEQIAQTLKEYKTILATDPHNIAALFKTADLLKNQGECEEADEFFERALEIEPENMEILGSYGDNLIRQGMRKQAAIQFKKMIDLDTEDAVAWIEYGMFLNGEGKQENAVPFLNKALELNQDRDPYVLLLYATYLREQKQLKKAILYFEKTLKITSDALSTFIHAYINDLCELGEYEKAERICQNALKEKVNKRDKAIFLRTYASVCRRQNKLKEAQKLYKQSFKTKENAIAYLGYGEVLKEWATEKSLNSLEKAVSLDPENVSILESYLKALYDANLLAKAQEYSRKILTFDRHHKLALIILEEDDDE